MRLLFLDIDGVVNSSGHNGLESEKLREVQRICHTAGAKIVLSSDWRRLREPRQFVERALTALGVEMVGATPELDSMYAYVRPQEILSWISTTKHAIEGWCAVDDRDLDIEDGAMVRGTNYFAGHFVQTDVETGLTPALADECIRLLGASAAPLPLPDDWDATIMDGAGEFSGVLGLPYNELRFVLKYLGGGTKEEMTTSEKVVALRILNNLAEGESADTCAAIVNSPILNKVVGLLEAGPANAQLAALAASALATLGTQRAHDGRKSIRLVDERASAIAESGAVPRLVGLLGSTAVEPASRATRGRRSGRGAARAAEVPKRTAEEALATHAAVRALERLAGSACAETLVCPQIADADGVTRLLALIGADDDVTDGDEADSNTSRLMAMAAEVALRLLRYMALHSIERTSAIVSAGGVPKLVELLKRGLAGAGSPEPEGRAESPVVHPTAQLASRALCAILANLEDTGADLVLSAGREAGIEPGGFDLLTTGLADRRHELMLGAAKLRTLVERAEEAEEGPSLGCNKRELQLDEEPTTEHTTKRRSIAIASAPIANA